MLVLDTQDEREASSFHRHLVSWWADLWNRLRRASQNEEQDETKSKQGPRSLIL